MAAGWRSWNVAQRKTLWLTYSVECPPHLVISAALDGRLALAVPNTGKSKASAAFLLEIQRGIAQSFHGEPVELKTMQLYH